MTEGIAGTNMTALMPIRLEIAARIIAARESDDDGRLSNDPDDNENTIKLEAKHALRMADALIEAYNESL